VLTIWYRDSLPDQVVLQSESNDPALFTHPAGCPPVGTRAPMECTDWARDSLPLVSPGGSRRDLRSGRGRLDGISSALSSGPRIRGALASGRERGWAPSRDPSGAPLRATLRRRRSRLARSIAGRSVARRSLVSSLDFVRRA
jgi:hypothetical protein